MWGGGEPHVCGTGVWWSVYSRPPPLLAKNSSGEGGDHVVDESDKPDDEARIELPSSSNEKEEAAMSLLDVVLVNIQSRGIVGYPTLPEGG